MQLKRTALENPRFVPVWPDALQPRLGRGGAMPVHSGKGRARGLLRAAGSGAGGETQARAGVQCRHTDVRDAATDATGRRRGLSELAQHLPGMLSSSLYPFAAPQFAARFSA